MKLRDGLATVTVKEGESECGKRKRKQPARGLPQNTRLVERCKQTPPQRLKKQPPKGSNNGRQGCRKSVSTNARSQQYFWLFFSHISRIGKVDVGCLLGCSETTGTGLVIVFGHALQPSALIGVPWFMFVCSGGWCWLDVPFTTALQRRCQNDTASLSPVKLVPLPQQPPV